MRIRILLLFFLIIPFSAKSQIIADHTVVSQYESIPPAFIAQVKKMWVQVIGESHSGAYRYGVNLLAAQNPDFPAVGQEGGSPLSATDEYLRVSRTWWYCDPRLTHLGPEWVNWEGGEEEFWTNEWAIEQVKNNITHCNGTGNIPVHAVGFGWCWDMCSDMGSLSDTEFGCRWGGRSYYWNGSSFADAGFWGLDDGDNSLVDPGNSKPHVVNCQNYIDAIVAIDDHDPNTLCFFTTGPVDNYNSGGYSDTRNEGESGYQRYLKHEFIREHVTNNGGVLFDYADILSHNNSNELQTTIWNGHTFPLIHPDNDDEYDGGAGSCHISEEGCIRLAKAMWWMLARAAGWEGVNETPVEMAGYAAIENPDNTISIQWQTISEKNCLGFHIWQSANQLSDYRRINESIIPGHGTTSVPHDYFYTDMKSDNDFQQFYKIEEISTDGKSEFFGPFCIEKNQARISSFECSQNYPNPFNASTTIKYKLPVALKVTIKIFNSVGQEISTLVNENKNNGAHSIVWNGLDRRGEIVPSGIYVYQIQTESFTETRRMILIK